VTYARSKAESLNIDPELFESQDIHIHVPAGAIPKDGPSAGAAMATALVSVLTNRPIKSIVAMTGEITIRGRILPIGGLKEKAIGALRAGIRIMLVPEKNKKEIAELPPQVRRKLKFITVTQVEQVFDQALLPAIKIPKPKSKTKKGTKKPAAKTKARQPASRA
jgi:ATP-dependent Lon protease